MASRWRSFSVRRVGTSLVFVPCPPTVHCREHPGFLFLMTSSQVVVVGLLQAEPAPVPQPLPAAEVLRSQLSWWPFGELTLVYQCPPWTGRTKTGCCTLMWSNGHWPVEDDHFPWSVGRAPADTTPDAGRPLCCQGTLQAPVQLAV